MRVSHLFGPTAAKFAAIVLSSVAVVNAQDFSPVPAPNLDLSELGRVALTGDFDSISLYTYEGQNQNPASTNGSQSLLQQLPNGLFRTLQSSDAMIMAMCPFVRRDGQLAGVVVGGNFTSLNGTFSPGAALWNPTDNSVVPLTGLNGSVNALYCDQQRDTVYVGGDFMGLNSTNAIAWVGMDGWTNMPFAGFNGPVYSITRAPNDNVIFGGSFTGLGNMSVPDINNQQSINLQTANISSGPNSAQEGFSDPNNVICSAGEDGPGNTWLTADNGGGFWRADFGFGFEPRRLRIYNTHQDGRGTRTFRFVAFPISGIMNLTYTDPDTGNEAACDNSCPLSDDPDIPFQDFTFVNTVGMNSFQIDIREIYGAGGGFNGIELFQDDVYTYAVPDFNEPTCSNTSFPSNVSQLGPWSLTPSGTSVSPYLSADLTDPSVDSSSVELQFLPDIRQSGNYTVTLFTPGCTQDNSCSRRGRVNVTGIFTADGGPEEQVIYQTNDFDKYDFIYTGPVDRSRDSFRPRVIITPWQEEPRPQTIVALRVRFMLRDASSGGLNGIYEFDPDFINDETNNSNSTYNAAGESLSADAGIYSLAVVDDNTYFGGNFTTDGVQNIFFIPNEGNVTSLAGGGLNNAVNHIFPFGNQLYVGGNFTDTVEQSSLGINHVAVYDTNANEWDPLGAGVNGPVERIVPLMLNISSDVPETCITINGHFDRVQEYQDSPAFEARGFAIWVPSRNNWLQNLDIQAQAISGQLTAATNITDSVPLLAGTIQSQGWALSDAVSLSTSDGNVNIAPIGLQEQPPQVGAARLRKRDVLNRDVTGAITGLFVTDENRNITVLAGSFEAIASDDSTIHNVAFIRTEDDGSMTTTGLANGIEDTSIFRAVSRNQNVLSLGGEVIGNIEGNDVGGIVQWNINTAAFISPQPSRLTGDTVVVHTISTRPDTNDLYVGGNFSGAVEFQCPGICVYSDGAWSRPGQTIDGTISQMLWQGNDRLLVGGDISVSDNSTFIAAYEVENDQTWSIPEGASTVPGPVTALIPANGDSSRYWVSGNRADDQSAYLILFDGTNFNEVPDLFSENTVVRGLSVVTTSEDHEENAFLQSRLALMITGTINVPGFGNASAVIFDGDNLTPLILANSGNNQGSLSQLVTEQAQSFDQAGGNMRVGYVVAIALAIALGVMFLLIAVGLLIERRRRKAEGYKPAPQNYFEKTANMGRIPPERLFSSLNQPAAPRV